MNKILLIISVILLTCKSFASNAPLLTQDQNDALEQIINQDSYQILDSLIQQNPGIVYAFIVTDLGLKRTLLEQAAYSKSIKCLRLLIKYGSRLSTHNPEGNSALHLAEAEAGGDNSSEYNASCFCLLP